MKFSSAIIGGQLLLAATIYANPIADTANGLGKNLRPRLVLISKAVLCY